MEFCEKITNTKLPFFEFLDPLISKKKGKIYKNDLIKIMLPYYSQKESFVIVEE